MTWIAPWALAVAGLAAAAAGLLHLLARDRPPRWLLPTARFVAAGSARATRRARTPRDLPLLALRIAALLLAGAAFAGPVFAPAGGSIARVVLLDRSASAADPAGAVALARGRLRAGDRLVVFDTIATTVTAGAEPAALDSLLRAAPSVPHGSLSAGLVAATRIAGEAASAADSVALVVVSPLRGVDDAATLAIRGVWPGRVELVDVPARVPTDTLDTTDLQPRVRGPSGDALVAGARLAGATPLAGLPAEGRGVLLVRGEATAADSAFARAGGTLVVWSAHADSAAVVEAVVDTIGGFFVGETVVPFAAVRRDRPPAGRALARWVDGAPAITERALDAGCIRTAAVALPVAGDVTLRPGFQRALRDLLRPCAQHVPAVMPDSMRAALAGTGPLATASGLRADATRARATPWLLGAALALLLLEPLLRRTSVDARSTDARPTDGIA